MVCTPTSFDDVAAFLYRDPFPNANIIGAIERRLPEMADVWISAANGRGIEGVLVVAPGVAGERAIGIEAVTAAAAGELLDVLPIGEEMSFGLHRPLAVRALRQKLQVRADAVMIGFRCDADGFRADTRGVGRELTREDQRLVRRCRDEHFVTSFTDAIQGRRTSDGLEVHTFGVLVGSRLVARCLTTWGGRGIDRMIGTVWSVYTEPSYRSQGLGRAVVSAATSAILASGRTARYFSYSDNAASMRICRALGYRQDHEIQYFHGQRGR
jgi:ribosomal protein S18 acetylase RimI-like enzyme